MRNLLFFVCLFLCGLTSIMAQDYKNVDINKIPEEQIRIQAQKLKKSGATIEAVVSQAKMRGASESQIAQLKRRFSRYLPAAPKQDNTTLQKTNAQSVEEVKPLSEKVEFVPTAEDSLVFGFKLFNKANLTFQPSLNMSVGDAYVVGIGDEIFIDIYGAADQTYELVVAPSGAIMIPMVGPVKAAGLKFADLKVAINNKLKSIYSDMGSRTHANVRIGNVQPVTVNVIGEVHMPGSFTVSAASSLFNVLYLSGGPTAHGSFRDIQLIRGGKIIGHCDVYDYLLNGKTDGNVSLADGDVVMVPPYIKRVSVGGEFNRTGYFEAKEGESAADLIRYAGGFAPRALTSHLGVVRVGKYATEFREVTQPENFLLQNGDSLSVDKVNVERMDNVVIVEGPVFAEGAYEYQEGLTLSQLFQRAGGLTENTFMSRGVISRRKDDYTLEAISFNVADAVSGVKDVTLKSGDEVKLVSIDDMREAPIVSIYGAVNMPGEFDYRENITLGDLIVLASGFQKNASQSNVEIVRRLSQDEAEKNFNASGSTQSVVITKDLSIGTAANSMVLEPFDVVFIRETPSSKIGGSVKLSGAFLNPGDYGLVQAGVRLSDIVKRSGGLNDRADLAAARIYRKIEISRVEREVRLLQSSVLNDTIYYLRSGDEHHELVSVDLRTALEHPESDANIILQNGDELVVPECDFTVRVAGNVQSSTSMVWHKGWNAKDYVMAAGGFSSKAQRRKTYVVYPNGQSESVKHILWFRKYPKVRPGAEVIVPEKPESTMTLPSIVSMSSTVLSMVVVIVTLTRK